jgi:hypothetical protein
MALRCKPPAATWPPPTAPSAPAGPSSTSRRSSTPGTDCCGAARGRPVPATCPEGPTRWQASGREWARHWGSVIEAGPGRCEVGRNNARAVLAQPGRPCRRFRRVRRRGSDRIGCRGHALPQRRRTFFARDLNCVITGLGLAARAVGGRFGRRRSPPPASRVSALARRCSGCRHRRRRAFDRRQVRLGQFDGY